MRSSPRPLAPAKAGGGSSLLCRKGSKPGVALGLFEPLQIAHRVIESLEIALLLLKERAERGHELRIARDRGEQRVVRPARKQPVVAGEAAPGSLERPVFVQQLAEQALFSGAFFLDRGGTLVKGGEPCAVFDREGVELRAPAPGFGVSLALRGRPLA